jgi:hypothetical protein
MNSIFNAIMIANQVAFHKAKIQYLNSHQAVLDSKNEFQIVSDSIESLVKTFESSCSSPQLSHQIIKPGETLVWKNYTPYPDNFIFKSLDYHIGWLVELSNPFGNTLRGSDNRNAILTVRHIPGDWVEPARSVLTLGIDVDEPNIWNQEQSVAINSSSMKLIWTFKDERLSSSEVADRIFTDMFDKIKYIVLKG